MVTFIRETPGQGLISGSEGDRLLLLITPQQSCLTGEFSNDLNWQAGSVLQDLDVVVFSFVVSMKKWSELGKPNDLLSVRFFLAEMDDWTIIEGQWSPIAERLGSLKVSVERAEFEQKGSLVEPDKPEFQERKIAAEVSFSKSLLNTKKFPKSEQILNREDGWYDPSDEKWDPYERS